MADFSKDISFSDLNKLLQGVIESQNSLVESQKETDAKFQETDAKFQETDAKFQESRTELDKRFKETDQRIKAAFDLFEGQWGKLMESLIEGDLVNLLKARGIAINYTSARVSGKNNGHNYEFDIIAHNGEEIVVVEVKTTLRVKHVRHFVEQLEKIKTYIPTYKKMRIIGAIAYLLEQENSATYAMNKKLLVIRATGDSAAIINPKDFQPRIF